MNIFFRFLSLFILCTVSAANAQETKEPLATFAWQPQVMIAGGFRTDIGFRIGHENSWVMLSPQLFLRNRPWEGYLYNGSTRYTELRGWGVSLSHRYYFYKRDDLFGVYLGYGGTYNYYKLAYQVYDWGNIDYLGLPAVTMGVFKKHTTIDKMGVDIHIGYQFVAAEKLFIDMFLGGGIRYSLIQPDELVPNLFSNGIFSYGHTGTVPLIGLRIGIIL